MNTEKDKNSSKNMKKVQLDIEKLKAIYSEFITTEDNGLSPRIRLELAEDFQKHSFWRKILTPAIRALMGRIYIELEDCIEDELSLLQSQLKAYRTMLEFPKIVIERAKDDLAIAGLKNEQEEEMKDAV